MQFKHNRKTVSTSLSLLHYPRLSKGLTPSFMTKTLSEGIALLMSWLLHLAFIIRGRCQRTTIRLQVGNAVGVTSKPLLVATIPIIFSRIVDGT